MSKKWTLFIPALNEIDGLRENMPQIPRDLFDQILVVDGNSKDGTLEYCKENGYEVIEQTRPGLRGAYIDGFPLVRNEYVLTFSPDGNCIPGDCKKILDMVDEGDYDMVIASRYFGGEKSEDDTLITAFGNWLFTNVINLLHGSRYSDAMTIFRGYKTKLFYELDIDKDSSYFMENWYNTVMGCEPLISVRAAKAKLKCGEFFSFEPARDSGAAKLQVIRWGLAYMSQVILETVMWKEKLPNLKKGLSHE